MNTRNAIKTALPLLLLLSSTPSFAAYQEPQQQKQYKKIEGERFMHFCSPSDTAGPELVCLKSFLNHVYMYGNEPMTDREYLRVYKMDKLQTLKLRSPKNITLTINKEAIATEKAERAAYKASLGTKPASANQ